MNETLSVSLALFALSFAFSVCYGRLLVPALRRRRAAQPILEIGPAWHLSKAGTPTMGGLAFIGGIGSALLLFSLYLLYLGERGELRAPALVFCYGILCGAVGFYDDYRKLVKKNNQGLTAWQKYLCLLLISAAFLLAAHLLLGVDTSIALPFTARRLELGIFYHPLALLYLTGLVNALNLTDGVDGLLSTLTAVIAAFFLLWGYVTGQGSVTVVGACLLGGALGFLCFNAHPARVFMGDTGSLFFGGMVSAVGIVTRHPLLVLIASGVFVAETASVILQVVFFKVSGGKRLFRMAPLHHHFEKGGWGEWRVVAVFAVSGILLAVLAFFGR